MKKKKAHELPKRLENELVVSLPEESYTRIRHAVNLGDIVSSLAAVKTFWSVTGRKVIYAQQIGQLAQYYPGAVHPTVNEEGANVCVNQQGFDMIKPLVESQPYIHKMEQYLGQPVSVDFDVIRQKTFVNLPNGMIQSWVMFAFPDLACDLSKPWIELTGDCPEHILTQVKGKIILNFTERYRNHIIDYFFLKHYAPDLVFAGTEREHWIFCNKWQIDCPRLIINDFLDYAYAIREARFILGNQSLGWNLAEAMKTPRLLEVCNYAPNCAPFVGEHSFGYYHQVGGEYFFRRMYNTLR